MIGIWSCGKVRSCSAMAWDVLEDSRFDQIVFEIRFFYLRFGLSYFVGFCLAQWDWNVSFLKNFKVLKGWFDFDIDFLNVLKSWNVWIGPKILLGFVYFPRATRLKSLALFKFILSDLTFNIKWLLLILLDVLILLILLDVLIWLILLDVLIWLILLDVLVSVTLKSFLAESIIVIDFLVSIWEFFLGDDRWIFRGEILFVLNHLSLELFDGFVYWLVNLCFIGFCWHMVGKVRERFFFENWFVLG